MNSDGGFNQDLTECDVENDPDARSCTVSYSSLTTDPFNLEGNDTVQATVTAMNSIGDSTKSDVGGTAIVPTVPAAPTNLERNDAETDQTEISFSWTAPAGQGVVKVIDYTVEIKLNE